MGQPLHQVQCYCKFCGKFLFTCENVWIQITESYFTNANKSHDATAEGGLVASTTTHGASSELEGCLMRSLRCNSCKYWVGSRCAQTSPQKQQYKDRNFIKLAKVTFKLSSDGEIIKPNVIEALPAVDADIISANAVKVNGNSTGSNAPLSEIRTDIDRVIKCVEDLKVDMTRMCSLIDGMHKYYIAQVTKGGEPPKADLHAKYVQEKLDSLTKQVSTLEKKSKETDGRFEKLEGKSSSPIELSKDSTDKQPVATANGTSSRRSSKVVRHPDPPAPTAPAALANKPEITAVEKESETAQQPNATSNHVSEPVGGSMAMPGPSSLQEPNLNLEGRFTRKRARKNKPLRRPTILKFNQNNRVALEGFGPGETPDASHLEIHSAKLANPIRTDNLNKVKSADNSPRKENGNRRRLSSSTISSSEDEDEDEEYEAPEDPASPKSRRSGYRTRGGRGRARGRGHAWTNGVKEGRVETPEWEKPDWTGPEGHVETPTSGPPPVTTPVSSRGRTIIRRGHSGNVSGSASKRQKTGGDGSSPGFVELGRVRDSEGYLLRPNGERDKRSLRRKEGPVTPGSGKKLSHDKLTRQIFSDSAEGQTAEEEQVEVKAEG